jgi:hypothetical protein
MTEEPKNWVVNMRHGQPYDVRVDRATIYGNPFSHKPGTRAKFLVATREEAIQKFEEYLLGRPSLLKMVREHLRGKVLACWCWPDKCHAQVLARIANE